MYGDKVRWDLKNLHVGLQFLYNPWLDILACRPWKQKSNNGSHLPNQKSPSSIPSTKLPKPFSLLDFDPLNYSIKRIRRSFVSPSLIFVPVRARWVGLRIIYVSKLQSRVSWLWKIHGEYAVLGCLSFHVGRENNENVKMEHWTSLMIIFFFFFFFLFVCSLYVPKYLNQIIRSETIKKRMDYCVLTL